MNSEGKKMGKTASGAVWLDPGKTSPYEFYQYWRNIGDADVMKCLKMLTFFSLDELDEMEKWDDERINEKKELLAHHLTSLVHGEEEAEKARNVSAALFSGKGDDSNMPSVAITENMLKGEEAELLELLVYSGLAASRTDGRRLISQGGITVNGQKAEREDRKISLEELRKGVKIRKGKKIFCRVFLK